MQINTHAAAFVVRVREGAHGLVQLAGLDIHEGVDVLQRDASDRIALQTGYAADVPEHAAFIEAVHSAQVDEHTAAHGEALARLA